MTRRWTAAAAVALQAFAAAASACPMCKDSITDTAAGAGGGPGGPTPGLPVGFNISVYLMLVGLFCVMGLVGRVIVKGIKGADARRPTDKPPGFPLD